MSNLGNKEIMAKNIRHYMELNNKTRTEICKDLKVSYSTFSDWVNAKTYPRIDKIEMMANYFSVEKSDLVEEKTPHMVKEEATYYVNDEARQIGRAHV